MNEPDDITRDSESPVPEAATRKESAAGLPLEAGLRALSEEMPRGPMSRALARIGDRLARGEPLQRVLEDTREPAPLLLRELLRCGLATGKVAEVLAAWLNDTRRAGEVRRRIVGGLAYPAVLFGFMVAILTALMLWVIPELGRLTQGFNTELPSMTVFVLKLSAGLRMYGLWILLGLAVAVLAVVFWPRFTGNPSAYRQLLHAVPVIGTAFRFAAVSTFCRLLAELVQHRVPLPAAIRAAGDGARDAVLELRCRMLADRLEQGMPLNEAATAVPQFPAQLAYAFRVADSPASFVEVLRGTAEMYEGQARVRAGLVPLIAEPVVIAGIAVTFILLVVAMFLPLIKLITSLT
jgi:type II secretory pathway component PulF